MKRYVIGLVVLALAAGGGWAWRASAMRPTEARVSVATVTRGEFVISLLSEGTLQSEDSVVVRTGKAAGQLTTIASDGMVLQAGDVFCSIEARDLLRKLADAELDYKQRTEEIEQSRESAQERIENDQQRLEDAQRDFEVWEESVGMQTRQTEDQLEFDRAEAERLRLEYERVQRMADKGYKAGAEAEVAKASYEAQTFKVEQSAKDLELNRRQIASERRKRESSVAAAERRVGVSRGRIGGWVTRAEHRAEVAAEQLANVREALQETTILAPASGTVSLFSTFRGGQRRPWREGDQVSSGTPLGTISGSEDLSAWCRIKENSIAALRKGQEAEIEFAAVPGHIFKGEVSTVGTVAREVWVWEDPTAEANERVFDVVVKVAQDRPGELKPGLNARVRIVVQRLPDVLFLPLDAVFERGGKSLAYVKQRDGFTPREIETGERNDVAVVVRSGLSEGEAVALSDPTRYPAKEIEKSR